MEAGSSGVQGHSRLWQTPVLGEERGGGSGKEGREAFSGTNTQILVAFHHLAQHQAMVAPVPDKADTSQPPTSTGSAHLWCTSTHPVEPVCTPWQSHCGTQACSHHLYTVIPVLFTLSAQGIVSLSNPGVGGWREPGANGDRPVLHSLYSRPHFQSLWFPPPPPPCPALPVPSPALRSTSPRGSRVKAAALGSEPST